MIILKVAKNQGFSLSLENIFFEKPQKGSNWPPPPPTSRFRFKTGTGGCGSRGGCGGWDPSGFRGGRVGCGSLSGLRGVVLNIFVLYQNDLPSKALSLTLSILSLQ